MATEPISPNSAEYAWASSVVDAVERISGRRARWDGSVYVTDDPQAGRTRPDYLLSKQTEPIYLQREEYEQVGRAINGQPEPSPRAALDRSTFPGTQPRWTSMTRTTAGVAVQAAQLTGRPAVRPQQTPAAEANLGAGLAKVWVQENWAAVVSGSDSARLMGSEDSSLGFYGGPQESAARDAITQLVQQQEQRYPTPDEYSAISYELLREPSDVRFQAVVGMIPEAGQLDDDNRRALNGTFRDDFHRAVRQGNLGAGTHHSDAAAAVRAATSKAQMTIQTSGAAQVNNGPAVGPPLPGQDPALVTARLATSNTAGTQTQNGSVATGGQLNRTTPKPPGIGE